MALKLIARVGDIVKHAIVTGSVLPNGNCIKTLVEGPNAAHFNGDAFCDGESDSIHPAGTFQIVATGKALFEGQKVARDGDSLTCGATIVAGSVKTFAG